VPTPKAIAAVPWCVGNGGVSIGYSFRAGAATFPDRQRHALHDVERVVFSPST
jgi:hypothetical protein